MKVLVCGNAISKKEIDRLIRDEYTLIALPGEGAEEIALEGFETAKAEIDFTVYGVPAWQPRQKQAIALATKVLMCGVNKRNLSAKEELTIMQCTKNGKEVVYLGGE